MSANIDFQNGEVSWTTAWFPYTNSLSDNLNFTATVGEQSISGARTVDGPTSGSVKFEGLTPNTTYTVVDGTSTTLGTFSTLPDNPMVATESMWADLASRIKSLENRLTILESN